MKRSECPSFRLGWVMIDEMASEGPLNWAERQMIALTWAMGFEYGKRYKDAQEEAQRILDDLVVRQPWVTRILERIDPVVFKAHEASRPRSRPIEEQPGYARR